MPNETFYQWELRHDIPASELEKTAKNERHLWLIGYVDYFDRFGDRHRSGYARKYIPVPLPGSPNNLVFTEPGYNYDVDIDDSGRPHSSSSLSGT